MAQSKTKGNSASKVVPAKDRISIFERYKDFLEEHLSRDDHNAQKVETRQLTVKAKGTFDYVSLDWEIHSAELKADYPDVRAEQWTLWGLRHINDLTKLNLFPKVIEGEVFLQTSQLWGSKRDYLKAGTSANFAFFLVGKYHSFLKSSQEKIVGPLMLSLTPLRATTQEMWKEIAEVMRVEKEPAANDKAGLHSKVALLDEFTEKEKTIQTDPDLTDEQKSTKIERLWVLYNLFDNP